MHSLTTIHNLEKARHTSASISGMHLSYQRHNCPTQPRNPLLYPRLVFVSSYPAARICIGATNQHILRFSTHSNVIRHPCRSVSSSIHQTKEALSHVVPRAREQGKHAADRPARGTAIHVGTWEYDLAPDRLLCVTACLTLDHLVEEASPRRLLGFHARQAAHAS